MQCCVLDCGRKAETKNFCLAHYRVSRIHKGDWSKIARSDIDKLLNRTEINVGGCWVWELGKDKDGYGMTTICGENKAHRASFRLFRGEIPEGFLVCHTCDNPSCVNPAHLFLGTHQENMNDMKEKGRRNGYQKLSLNQVLAIRASKLPRSYLAKRYGVSVPSIRNIQVNKTWKGVQI